MKNALIVAFVSLLALTACSVSQSCPGGYASSTWCSAPAVPSSDSN